MYMVYWVASCEAQCRPFGDKQLTEALQCCEALRTSQRDGEDVSFVTMASENPQQVGRNGVDSIVDGVCPDGVEYSWKKRR